MTVTFDRLCDHLAVHPDRRGEAWSACPFCGKDEGVRRPTHFSFSVRGFCCFVCGEQGGLGRLAEQVGLWPPTGTTPQSLVKAPKRAVEGRKGHGGADTTSRPWMARTDALLREYTSAPDRVVLWQRYKPLSVETIERWRLGVGVLPAVACRHRRLIYPVCQGGAVVAFRGRAIECECPKWLGPSGSAAALWGVEGLRPGAVVLIGENPVDAMLAMQDDAGITAVGGTAGVTWREEWTASIAASRPELVLIWLDNDLAGAPNAETYAQMVAKWRAAHPSSKQAPQPAGPRIANALLAAGVPAYLHRWPKGTPAKADLGDVLAGRVRA